VFRHGGDGGGRAKSWIFTDGPPVPMAVAPLRHEVAAAVKVEGRNIRNGARILHPKSTYCWISQWRRPNHQTTN